MRVEVEADVRAHTGPKLERLELKLWLRHEALKELEVPKLVDTKNKRNTARVSRTIK